MSFQLSMQMQLFIYYQLLFFTEYISCSKESINCSSWNKLSPFFKCLFSFILQPEKGKTNPLSDTQLQPSCLPPVRNPFKAPGKKDKDSEWRRMQSGADEEKRGEGNDSESHLQAGERESCQKEAPEHVEAGEKKEPKSNSTETYRGKQLPEGMKLKKRVSVEEQNIPKVKSVENINKTTTQQDKRKEAHTEPGEAEPKVFTCSTKAVHPEKTNQTVQDPHQDLNRRPTVDKTCLEQSDPTVSKSSPRSGTKATKDSDNTRSRTSNKPTQATESRHQDDDDDDVLLVSVKPAAQKSPPVSAVQKTLTAFPGFQPASKVKGPKEDPQGLRSLLTSQLQQKKVS